MNKWEIIVSKRTENKASEEKMTLVQKGLGFYFETEDGELVNPFFHNVEVARAIFEEDGEFLNTLGDMVILTPNGVEIEIQAL